MKIKIYKMLLSNDVEVKNLGMTYISIKTLAEDLDLPETIIQNCITDNRYIPSFTIIKRKIQKYINKNE